MTEATVTSYTAPEFVHHVSQQSHAMAGAVIALSAAQATALGQACLQISTGLGNMSAEVMDADISHMDQIKQELLQLCEKDAGAIADYVALRNAGKTLAGQQLLCQLPSDIGRLSVKAANILKKSRPLVSERVQDDLEMSVTLLAGTAQAAMLLLDSNLRLWPEQALLAVFEPMRVALELDISRLAPLKRIR